MVERGANMAFAAGAWVFPGGRIDEADRRLGEASGGAPAAIAAIRETIEETAVPVGLAPTPGASTCRGLQDALAADEPFADLLQATGLRLEVSVITPFAGWVPKFHALRWFARLFFLARCPSR